MSEKPKTQRAKQQYKIQKIKKIEKISLVSSALLFYAFRFNLYTLPLDSRSAWE